MDQVYPQVNFTVNPEDVYLEVPAAHAVSMAKRERPPEVERLLAKISNQRAERIKRVIAERFDSQADFSRSIDKSGALISSYLSGRKHLGEHLTREIEFRLGLPAYALDGQAAGSGATSAAEAWWQEAWNRIPEGKKAAIARALLANDLPEAVSAAFSSIVTTEDHLDMFRVFDGLSPENRKIAVHLCEALLHGQELQDEPAAPPPPRWPARTSGAARVSPRNNDANRRASRPHRPQDSQGKRKNLR